MMQILADSCLALLASIGLWTLCKMLFDCLFCDTKSSDNTIVVQIRDDYPNLDPLLQKELSVVHDFRLILVDHDLSCEEDFPSGVPAEKPVGVLFCSCKQFSNKVKEAKKWTIQKSTIK